MVFGEPVSISPDNALCLGRRKIRRGEHQILREDERGLRAFADGALDHETAAMAGNQFVDDAEADTQPFEFALQPIVDLAIGIEDLHSLYDKFHAPDVTDEEMMLP